MTHRILTIDIGNSRCKLAGFSGGELIEYDYLPSAVEYAEKLCGMADEWHAKQPFERIIIGAVVPSLSDLITTLIESRLQLRPIHVSDFKTRLLPLRVDYPETVGVDRAVNCYAAVHLFGAPAIVVSLGTATTFEAVSEAGEYLGGSILPGVKISLEALTQRTALLPPVEWSEPKSIIATTTIEHIKSGIYYGTVAMIEGMVRRMRETMGQPAKVIGTGGISNELVKENIFDVHEPLLTLRGLEAIARNEVWK